jgi:SAM-dependent methyltransferase
MYRVRLFSRFSEKAIFEWNKGLFKKIYKGFVFHAVTKQLETNPLLGVGNGHALSRDLHLLIPQLRLLRVLGSRTILDLGSGDGFVLRAAKQLNYLNLFGVEADVSLAAISRLNLTRSKIFQNYFQDFNPADIGYPIDVVYIFNPDLPEIVESTLFKLQPLGCRFYLTKNFKFSSNASNQLNVRLLWRLQSYTLYQTKGRKIEQTT